MLGGESRDGSPSVHELASAGVQPRLLVPEQAFEGGPRMLNEYQSVDRLAHEPIADERLESLGRQAETPSQVGGNRREGGWTRTQDASIELLGVRGDLEDSQVRAHGEQTVTSALTKSAGSATAPGSAGAVPKVNARDVMCGRLGPLALLGHFRTC